LFYPRCKEIYKFTIADKPIYVFENHAAALLAWQEISKGYNHDLLTFDEHPDLHSPLRQWIYGQEDEVKAKRDADTLLEKSKDMYDK